MGFLNVFFTLLFLFIVVYLWNKYVIEFIINWLEKFHREQNFSNLEKQPIKFFIKNKKVIIKFAKAFYWIGFAIISVMLIMNYISHKKLSYL